MIDIATYLPKSGQSVLVMKILSFVRQSPCLPNV